MNPEVVFYVWQFLSGTAAMAGGVLLIYYGIRLAVRRAKKLKPQPAVRARLLITIAAAYGLAVILAVFIAEQSPIRVTHALWLATAVVAALRCRVWRRRMSLTPPVDLSTG